jgi:hypothetical protein
VGILAGSDRYLKLSYWYWVSKMRTSKMWGAIAIEHEVTRVLQMLDAIQDKMGIENDDDSELADLEIETKPEDVLNEIERIQQLTVKRKKLGKRKKN